jgi:hypothetical protein
MLRQKWPARWCGRLGGALRYNDNNHYLHIYYRLYSSLVSRIYAKITSLINSNEL